MKLPGAFKARARRLILPPVCGLIIFLLGAASPVWKSYGDNDFPADPCFPCAPRPLWRAAYTATMLVRDCSSVPASSLLPGLWEYYSKEIQRLQALLSASALTVGIICLLAMRRVAEDDRQSFIRP